MMDILKKYKISFSGLQIGHHSFDFQINDQFFESFEKSKVQQGNLDLRVEMDKSETMIQLRFNFKGKVVVECDRCLDEFTYPLEFNEMLIVKFGYKTHEEESEDILVIDLNEYEINIAQYIYEYINLSLPMQIIHSDVDGISTCNAEFLKNFDQQEIENEQDMDPRWDALKGLK